MLHLTFNQLFSNDDLMGALIWDLEIESLINIANVDQQSCTLITKLTNEWLKRHFPSISLDGTNFSALSYLNRMVAYTSDIKLIGSLKHTNNLKGMIYAFRITRCYFMPSTTPQLNVNDLFPQNIPKENILFYILDHAAKYNLVGVVERFVRTDFEIPDDTQIRLLNGAFISSGINNRLVITKCLAHAPQLKDNIDDLVNNRALFKRAAQEGHLEMVKFLFNATKITSYNMTSALKAAHEGHHKQVEAFLLEKMPWLSENDKVLLLDEKMPLDEVAPIYTPHHKTKKKFIITTNNQHDKSNEKKSRNDKCIVM